MHRSNTPQVLDIKENLQERLVLATEKRPKSTQYSHQKTHTAPLSAMSTSTETQSRGIDLKSDSCPIHGVSHVIINAVERISKKNNSKNISETPVTPLQQLAPKYLPSHLYTPACLQMSRNLSPKQRKRQTSALNTRPSFSEKKTERTFPLQALPKKRIAFKSPPCLEGELLVQVTFEVSMFYQRITNIIWEVLPKLFITVSWDHNLNHCRCLPIGGKSPQATNPKVKLGGFSRILNNQTG